METSNPLLQRDIDFSTVEATAPMSLQGTVNKTGFLLLLCMASAAFSWMHPQYAGPLIILGLIGGMIACLAGTFAPKTAPISAPAYALLEGLCLGALSQMFDNVKAYHGIVANAVLLTFSVLALMLVLYSTRIIRVTQRFMIGIMMATGAIAVVYLLDIILSMFGLHIPMVNGSSAIGIGFSLFVVGVASFSLLMDFAVIENNVRQGAPKYMEWYCGMALLVTLVWLYLEILRLLAKMQKRD